MNQDDQSDLEWVKRVQKGETDAFEVLVRRHEKKVFNLLYRWLGDLDDATDAAQEVFLAAYRAIRQFRGDSQFATWLYRIAINHAKNRRKQLGTLHQRMTSITPDDPENNGAPVLIPAHPGPSPAQAAEQKELKTQVQEALNRLKSDDALIILLHDLQQFPYEEIAQMLDLPIGTVKSRLHRARLALKAKLAPYYDPARSGR